MKNLLLTIVNFIFGIIELGLTLRFLFELFGANPNATFTSWLYTHTQWFVSPFLNIFTIPQPTAVNYFDIATLLAILIYGLIAYIISAVILSV